MILIIFFVLTFLILFVHFMMAKRARKIEHYISYEEHKLNYAKNNNFSEPSNSSYEEYKSNYEKNYRFIEPSEVKHCNCDCNELKKELDNVCIPVISKNNYCRGQLTTAPQRCNFLLDLIEEDYQKAVLDYKEGENKNEIKKINLLNEINTCKEESRIMELANSHLEKQNKEIEEFGSKMSDTVTERDKEVVKDKITGKIDKCKTMTKLTESHKGNLAALEEQLNQARDNLSQYYNNISQIQRHVPQAHGILDRCIEVRAAQAKAAAEAAAKAAAEAAAKG